MILVANKCDTANKSDASLADFKKTTERVERLVKDELNEWQERRRPNRRYAEDVTTVRPLESVYRISCNDNGGIDELKDFILSQDAASIQVPPAWDLALKVVKTLRTGGDPLRAARNHLELNQTGETDKKKKKRVVNLFTSKGKLSKLWENIVGEVSGELEDAKKAAVSNAESALNGALWIR